MVPKVSASVQGASFLQGGSQILYSLFSGLAMLYIYITSIACHYRCIFAHCLSLSAHICSMPVRNHRTLYNSICFSMIWNSSPDLPDLLDLPEVSHLLQFGTSSTRAGCQDDVSSNKLPQTIVQRGGSAALNN